MLVLLVFPFCFQTKSWTFLPRIFEGSLCIEEEEEPEVEGRSESETSIFWIHIRKSMTGGGAQRLNQPPQPAATFLSQKEVAQPAEGTAGSTPYPPTPILT